MRYTASDTQSFETAGDTVTAEQDIWISQIRKGLVEIAILALLSEGEMYGSQIVTVLGSHPELAISVGTVYPLLSRLKKAGVVESTWRESPSGPPRKYYRLTRTGEAELHQMTEAWRGVSKTIDGLLDGGAAR